MRVVPTGCHGKALLFPSQEVLDAINGVTEEAGLRMCFLFLGKLLHQLALAIREIPGGVQRESMHRAPGEHRDTAHCPTRHTPRGK